VTFFDTVKDSVFGLGYVDTT